MISNFIKTAFFLFIMSFFFWTCDAPNIAVPDEDSPLEHETELKFHEIQDEDVEMITIDNCEYIVYQHNAAGSNHAYGFMAHKGNCSNPVHVYNKPEENNKQE